MLEQVRKEDCCPGRKLRAGMQVWNEIARNPHQNLPQTSALNHRRQKKNLQKRKTTPIFLNPKLGMKIDTDKRVSY